MLNTARKIRIARELLRILQLCGVPTRQVVARRGVTFDLDLTEGIDLSLFLFGAFQPHVLREIRRHARTDGIVIDIGANSGSIALPTARLLAQGRIYAFEPTDDAFARLQANLALNPDLRGRVTPIQAFVADTNRVSSGHTVYSSWPLPDATSRDPARHPVHLGRAVQTACPQLTLDAFVVQAQLQRVDVLKIDTDGHEFSVLRGATRCLEQFRPAVIFEACEYLMRPPAPTFEDFARFFARFSYRIHYRGAAIGADEFRRLCPANGGLDLTALPELKQ